MVNRVREFRLAAATRRTVYGFVDRADLLEEFNTFDVANGTAPTGKRYESTVPQQALYLMNSPLVIEQVRRIVQRSEFRTQANAVARVRYLYDLFFQREPSQEEINAGVGFIRHRMQLGNARTTDEPVARFRAATSDGTAKEEKTSIALGPWQEYAHALLLTNEAAFVE